MDRCTIHLPIIIRGTRRYTVHCHMCDERWGPMSHDKALSYQWFLNQVEFSVGHA